MSIKKAQFLTFTLLFVFALLLPIRVAAAQSNNTNHMVRLVYFLPSDRPAQPERVRALRQLIKDAQEFYADEMQRHGFGRKTFTTETNRRGEPVVHRVNGKFNEDYYYEPLSDSKIWEEVYEHFDALEHVYFIAIDLSHEALNGGDSCGLGGFGLIPMGGHSELFAGKIAFRHRDETSGEENLGGSAIIPVSGDCFEDTRGYLHPLRATTHELGHAFGLDHDFRDTDAVVGGRGYRLSKCAAEWLFVHRFFNTYPTGRNRSGSIKLLQLSASGQSEIHLRFQVNDPDGLHQAQLLVPEDGSWGPLKLIGCQELAGQKQTLEFVTAELLAAPPVERVVLQFMDKGGNITWATFLIDINSVLPPPKVVSIPDRNLARVIRETLGLGRNARITDQQMLTLRELDAKENQIKNLTGLEHARQLTGLFLYNNEIRSVNPLTGLTQLRVLGLDNNQINNIRPLSGLTQLELLYIGGNQINNSGVRHLTKLQQLKGLSLYGNKISNIKPIAKLTKLEALWLSHNKIRDVSPLAELVNLETLHLDGNPIKDFSPLANLTNLQEVVLAEESETRFLSSGPKIEGPWLWMIVPTGRIGGKAAATSGKDYLAVATKRAVTEKQIATKGATVGKRVRNRKWTWGKLAPTGGDNIMETVRAIGLARSSDINNHVAYASIALRSPRKQKTTMYVGSDDAVKVWLNGKLVHDNPIDRGAEDYQDSFPVTLKKGKNILLVAVYEWGGTWSGFFGFENDAKYTVIVPASVMNRSPAAPQLLTPDQTSVLPNYPNPFNPETWIPYQLSEPADVILSIYAVNGRLVRTLDLGHQPAGTYQNKSRAAYWNGRNEVDEPVASGIYFYTLTANDFTATRKMLILK